MCQGLAILLNAIRYSLAIHAITLIAMWLAFTWING